MLYRKKAIEYGSKRKKCSIKNYFKKNRDFFVVFVVLCVSCSCIPYGDKIVGFSHIMPCKGSLIDIKVAISEQGLPA